MRQVIIEAYNFEELSDDLKKKVLEKIRTRISESGTVLIGFNEVCQDIAKDKGFDIKEDGLRYSLSNSQGDGVSITATIDIEFMLNEFAPNRSKKFIETISNNIKASCDANTGRYSYASPSDIEIFVDNNSAWKEYENINEWIRMFELFVRNRYLMLCKQLEQLGYDYIENSLSDKSCIEYIELNEIEFDKFGNVFKY